MNWNTHIFNISKTITKTLGVMNRLKHYLPQRILQILYNSLILSHLNSNITAWGFASHKLCRLQKRALRLITDSRYTMRILNHYLKHYAPLHWMILLKCNVLNFTINLFKVNCHHFLTHFLLKKLPFIITKLAVEMISTFKPHIQSTAQNCMRYYIPKLLSMLPTRVTEKIHTHSYTGFCMYMKKYFVDQYNDSCSIIHCYICSN